MSADRMKTLSGIVVVVIALLPRTQLSADDLRAKDVRLAIDRAVKFLEGEQGGDGSWDYRGHKIGATSVALLALLNAGRTIDDPSVKKALGFLRPRTNNPTDTYDASLMIMALATAKDGTEDRSRIREVARKLEDSQVMHGDGAGLWDYKIGNSRIGGGDRSNGQFAVLGLRDAAYAGVEISRETWQRVDRHWRRSQQSDGGWGYRGANSSGSMTVAGIATLSITRTMLRGIDEEAPDGKPLCCVPQERDKALERALIWMRRFTPGSNPGGGNQWVLYYLYGVERAGRLSGRRFFGDHDWYREGTRYLIDQQDRRKGAWGGRPGQQDAIVGTSFALLFLSKGLAPVVINKAKFGIRDPANRDVVPGDDWNKHSDDVRNLTQFITTLPKWQKLLNWQIVDLDNVLRTGSVDDLLQAPILYLSGEIGHEFSPREVELLKSYVEQGGYIFAVNCCNGAGFETGVRNLVKNMFPGGALPLKPLPPEHPVFRSENLLDPTTVELHGVDFGCRTAIIYSPDDLSCLWDKWMPFDPPKRSITAKTMIRKGTRVGVNVVAYATGRKPPDKELTGRNAANEDGTEDKITRGLLQVAKLRHKGRWDAAPQALRNLLIAMNRFSGPTASTVQRALPATDKNLFRYPVVYMHGRDEFQLSEAERKQLRHYLENQGFLFADACCGSSDFDESFRELIRELFPNRKLTRIPITNALFSDVTGSDIRRVKRRTLEPGNDRTIIAAHVEEVEPFLEGIEIDGRLAVVYSKFDISCALEQQVSLACSGYLPEDALKIGINVLRYALLQDVNFMEQID